MSDSISPKHVEAFLKGVMRIEKKYGNELREQKTARQNDLREWTEKFTVEELDSED